MERKKYIDKTYPITLQDLIDLAKAYNLDPHDLKLIINDSNPDYTDYTSLAMINQDQDNLSIELYSNNPLKTNKNN